MAIKEGEIFQSQMDKVTTNSGATGGNVVSKDVQAARNRGERTTGLEFDDGVNNIIPKRTPRGADTSFLGSFQAPNEAKIREEQRRSALDQVEGIEDVFTGKLAREAEAGQGREGQTRALSSRSGILGQDFGQAQAKRTESANEQLLSNIEAQKSLEINAVFDKFDQRAQDEIERQTGLAILGETARREDQEKLITDARNDLATIAGSGLAPSLELLSEEDRAMLKEQGGFKSDFMFKAFFNSNLPKEQQAEFEFKTAGDKVFLFDKTSGGIEEIISQPPDDEPGWEVADIMGTPTWVKTDDGGNITDFKKFEEGITDLERRQAEADIKQTEADIKQTETDVEKTNAEVIKIFDDISSKGEVSEDDKINSQIKYEQLLALRQKNSEAQAKEDKIKMSSDQEADVFQSKLDLIDRLLGSNGLGDSVGVGVGAFSRVSLDEWFTGDKSDWLADIKNLLSRETMDTLTALKERGGTLGALSDQERIMLQNAASIFGEGEKDKNGNITGFRVTEGKAKEELNRLRENTRKLIEAARAEAGTPVVPSTDLFIDLD